MTYVADPLQFAQTEAPTVTVRDLRAYLDAIPGDWSQDVRLVEGLARGDGLDRTAALMVVTPQAAVARWFALTKQIAVFGGNPWRRVSIDGQTMLLAELRRRAA